MSHELYRAEITESKMNDHECETVILELIHFSGSTDQIIAMVVTIKHWLLTKIKNSSFHYWNSLNLTSPSDSELVNSNDGTIQFFMFASYHSGYI